MLYFCIIQAYYTKGVNTSSSITVTLHCDLGILGIISVLGVKEPAKAVRVGICLRSDLWKNLFRSSISSAFS